jgi:hypothetical protein
MSTSLLLVVLLRDRWLERSTEQLLAGALVGSVIAVQQHKGLVLVPFVSLLVIMETMLDGGSWRVWVRRLSMSALGTLIVVVPVFGYALYLAGFEPVFQALVLHPLFEYAPSNTTHWGAVFPLARDLAANTYPNVLAWSPLVVPATLGIAVWSRRVGSSATESRRWLALTAITSASLASALYYPDFVHIAFAAPPAIVSATAIAAWCGRRFMEWAGDQNGARLRLAGRVAPVLLLGLLSAGAVRAWHATADGFDGQMETKFGRVAVSGDMLPTMVEAIATAMEESGAEEIYIHNFPQAYLYLDVDNPTPFQIINTANPLEDDLRIVEILEDRQIRIVVTLGGFLAPRPTLRDYLAARYSPVEPSEDEAIVKILRRNAF